MWVVGGGRVLVWCLKNKIKNKLIGVEYCADVARNLQIKMKKYQQVEILVGDINSEIFPKQGSIFYLFHPFNEDVLRKFIVKLIDNIKQCESPVFYRIIYYNCAYLFVFEEDPRWKIKRCGYHEGLPAAIISFSENQQPEFCV